MMTNEEKEKALNELLPDRKKIERFDKYLSYFPLILLGFVVVYLILAICLNF